MRTVTRLLLVTLVAACTADTTPVDPLGSIPSASSETLGANAATRPVAHASGTAHHTLAAGLKTVSFTATEFEDGSTVGQLQIYARGLREAHYRVVCLDVVGNAAYLGAVATLVARSPGSTVGEPFVFAVWDGGEGASAPPDQATRGRILREEPIEAICGDLAGYALVQTPYDVERGNVQVRTWDW